MAQGLSRPRKGLAALSVIRHNVPCPPPSRPLKPQHRYLSVNNVEVIYDHVILVLKGVSLEVPEGSVVALLGANGAGKSTTLKSISNLLCGGARRRHEGNDRVQGQARRQAHAQRARAHGRVPGDGRPALLRAPDGGGESADRRVHEQGAARRHSRESGQGLPLFPAPASSGGRACPATRRVASSR